MLDLIVRYLHFISIIVFSSALVAQQVLLKPEVSLEKFKQLMILDRLYGASALIVFLAGLSLWIGVGKPAMFYSTNPFFHIKLTLFVCMALLSIPVTVFLIKNRKLAKSHIIIPKYLIYLLRGQALILIIIPLFAVLMAAGYQW